MLSLRCLNATHRCSSGTSNVAAWRGPNCRMLTLVKPFSIYPRAASSLKSHRNNHIIQETGFCSRKNLGKPKLDISSSLHLRTYSQKAEDEKIEQISMKEKFKKFWHGPTFKYWFIGVSAFSAWLFYYSLKSYRSTRIDIDLPPAIPGHPLAKRPDEADNIIDKIRQGGMWSGKVKIFSLTGPTGSGKSLMAHFLVGKLISQVDWNPIGLPKSHIKVFLNGDTLKSFHLSLQAFAAKLKVRTSEIKSKLTEIGEGDSLGVQCHVLLDLIQEKLEKHPDWVIVVDNLQQGVSSEVVDVVKSCFSNDGMSGVWSRGIVLLTFDGISLDDNTGITQLKMEARMPEKDSIQLLKDITNIQDESFGSSPATKLLLNRIYHHPLSIVGVALLLKHRLHKKELNSIDGEIMKLIKEITENSIAVKNDSFIVPKTGISESLIIAETVIAMSAKLLLDNNLHIGHIFDLVSSCAPRIPIPSTFINRYLQHPSLKLPPMAPPIQPNSLQQMFRDKAVVPDSKGTIDEELEPKGKAWSNKNIAEYITNVENWFSEIVQAVKEVYNFYFNKLDFDVPVDDGLGMLRECALVLSSKIQPGDADSFTMHPLVYAAVRQNFLSSTIARMELNFQAEDEIRFTQQPWYKKMSNYDAKGSLQKFRNDLQKMPVDSKIVSNLLAGYNNAIINVRSIFENTNQQDQSLLTESNDKIDENGIGLITDEDKLKHLQSHLDRVIHTLSEDIRVAKQNIGGKTASKYLGVHADYLHMNHPIETTGAKAKVMGFLLLAKVASSMENNTEKAISYVNSALELLQNVDEGNDLETAAILCQLAGLYSTNGDHEKGRDYLQRAVDMYEAQRRKDGEYKKPLEFGKALGALGVLYGTLGDRKKSKELIERALMLQQTGAPDLSDEARSKHFGAEFASALTDLGHAYVSMGMPLYGKKILDLSLMAHKNIHGEKHHEVVRTLTVLSIAHLMQGHNEESKKLRKEAGKLQSQVNAMPAY